MKKFFTLFAVCSLAATAYADVTISLDRENLYFIPGQEAILDVTVVMTDSEGEWAPEDIEWSSDDEGIATVENGVVKGIAAGSTIITAAFDNAVTTCEVEVDPAPAYPAIEGFKYQTWNLTGESAYNILATAKVAVNYEGNPDGRGIWTLDIEGYRASFRFVESDLEDADVIEPLEGFTQDDDPDYPFAYYLAESFDDDADFASWCIYGNGYRNLLDYIVVYVDPEEYWTTADLNWTKNTARVNFMISWWPYDWTTDEFAEDDELGYLLLDIDKSEFGIDTLWTGVETAVEDCGETGYFNLQGIRVANPENGIYIMRQGNKVKKVVFNSKN